MVNDALPTVGQMTSEGDAMSEDEEQAALAADNEAATSQAVACLAETARQLREMADYLRELAETPIENSRTLH